jgi:chemotaxis methyl-accepting protein methylase
VTDVLDDGFQALTEKITRDTMFRCASYKDKCLRRRIASRMRTKGVTSYAEYAMLLDQDTREYGLLLDALTINVTKFFRNWTSFEALSRIVIPAIWEKPGGIRVWSAGTASGEEAYSLATLFYRHAVALGDERGLSRVEIIGSDIDRMSLAAANRAQFASTAFVETPDDILATCFPEQDGLRGILPEIRSMVQVERRDLLLEPPPLRVFDLIVCRNVIIYFDRAAQDELFDKFYQALAPSGFLMLGRVETLLGPSRTRFTPVDLRERIFRKAEQRR